MQTTGMGFTLRAEFLHVNKLHKSYCKKLSFGDGSQFRKTSSNDVVLDACLINSPPKTRQNQAWIVYPLFIGFGEALTLPHSHCRVFDNTAKQALVNKQELASHCTANNQINGYPLTVELVQGEQRENIDHCRRA
jgi:hypothetical protein